MLGLQLVSRHALDYWQTGMYVRLPCCTISSVSVTADRTMLTRWSLHHLYHSLPRDTTWSTHQSQIKRCHHKTQTKCGANHCYL